LDQNAGGAINIRTYDVAEEGWSQVLGTSPYDPPFISKRRHCHPSMKQKVLSAIQIILVLSLAACAFRGGQRDAVVVFDQQSFPGAKTVLDFMIDKAIIPRKAFSQVLLDIDDSLRATSAGKLRFSFGLERTEGQADAIVALSASHVSLGQLLDLLCAQAKWKYRQTPIGIIFSPR
jgi:hypothetical protein